MMNDDAFFKIGEMVRTAIDNAVAAGIPFEKIIQEIREQADMAEADPSEFGAA